MIGVGTAGWAVPLACKDQFPGEGSSLERYARVFGCAEINSTFKHQHRASTYARWVAATPAGFRFAAKVPQEITHRLRLAGVVDPLERFLAEVAALGDRLGPLLVQLPPSLGLDARVANTFFGVLRRRFDGTVVCEPRHADWFTAAADRLFERYRIGRVAADPVRVPEGARPGGWLGTDSVRGLAYFRWHGSPQVYRSSYLSDRLQAWADEVAEWHARCDCWCVFDNTTSGAAAANALELARLVKERLPIAA